MILLYLISSVNIHFLLFILRVWSCNVRVDAVSTTSDIMTVTSFEIKITRIGLLQFCGAIDLTIVVYKIQSLPNSMILCHIPV
jgi:hypothetical protein